MSQSQKRGESVEGLEGERGVAVSAFVDAANDPILRELDELDVEPMRTNVRNCRDHHIDKALVQRWHDELHEIITEIGQRLDASVTDSVGVAPNVARSEILVSSVSVKRGPHDRIRVWSRGGFAGELVVNSGDGAEIGQRLRNAYALERTVSQLRSLSVDIGAAAERLEEWLKAARDVDNRNGGALGELADLLASLCDLSSSAMKCANDRGAT